jgi:HPt (histidine-containing phosphotransfer) domain-containing protein
MNNESNIKNYKQLFDLCLKHSESLFVLLNSDLAIQMINPMIEKILGWDAKLVCGQTIDNVFKKNLTEPFVDINNPTVNHQITTFIFDDDNTLRINWDIIPVLDDKKECELIFVVGNYCNESQSKLSTTSDISNKDKTLGRDLPPTEKELFELASYPLLDVERVWKSINYDKSLLNDIFKSMAVDEIPSDLQIIREARLKNDWVSIEKIAHKMKGGAMYCGTTKMQYACQYFERYKKSGNKDMLERLYQQLIQVCKETESAIKIWLIDNN